MTLSPSSSAVLRGPELLDLPVVTLTNDVESSGPWRPEPTPEVPTSEQKAAIEEAERRAYDQGRRDGIAERDAEIGAGMASCLNALTIAADQLRYAEQEWTESLADRSIPLALEITGLLLMRELELSSDPGRDAIIRCLDQIAPTESACIALNPDDLNCLNSVDDLFAGRSIELVADADMPSGSARANFDGGTIDAVLAKALERVAEVLQ
ncbi:MAG: flagellar biosynthesis/type III secretory pathway protein FliH [Acidimicrobiales bacterium]|jgi:flagellar biosynthesis/type III secretory pathway protein FliH